MNSDAHKQRGFTLLEMMVVLVILGILASLVVPSLMGNKDKADHQKAVSDIVALKQNGMVSCHYVDSRGFKALPDFLKPENYLKNAEMAMEDDYGMIDGVGRA